MKQVYVWTFPTRVFHWLLAALIVGGWVSSLEDRWLAIHAAIGSAAAVLLLFRLVWGGIGPRYSRFGDFEFRFEALRSYLLSLFRRPRRHVGHNPAASYVMIAMLLTAAAAVVSGMLAYGVQENRGLLAFLHKGLFGDMERFEEIHAFFVNLMWVLIAAHVTGVMADRWLHPHDRTLASIVDGYKALDGENALLSRGQKTVAFVGIGGTVFLLLYALGVADNLLIRGYNAKVDYAAVQPEFVKECSSCHTLYPPALLPKESWAKLMGDLENHFGDDASLDPADHKRILAYLLNHSADTSTQEMSVKIVQTLKNRDIIAITQTPFWKQTHSAISAEVFKSGNVKSRANCKACHSDIEQGVIEDHAIRPIRKG